MALTTITNETFQNRNPLFQNGANFGVFVDLKRFSRFFVVEVEGLKFIQDLYQTPYSHYTSQTGGLSRPVFVLVKRLLVVSCFSIQMRSSFVLGYFVNCIFCTMVQAYTTLCVSCRLTFDARSISKVSLCVIMFWGLSCGREHRCQFAKHEEELFLHVKQWQMSQKNVSFNALYIHWHD